MVRLAAVCLSLLLFACKPTDPDILVFAVATAPGMLDPRLASDAASERVNALLYDRLVALDAQGRPRPAMADWRIISATQYRIRLLPQRATFPDGRPPDSADVVATYRSLLDRKLGSAHAASLGHIEQIEAVDADTVDFHLSRPDPLFPGRLTIGIIAADSAARSDLARRPHGSGPFAFVAWREDGSLLLERRRDGLRLAITPVADPTMRALKLLRGEAHLLQNDLPAELYGYLAATPGVQLQEHPGTTFAYLGFNLADPLLADRKVRAAIAHAIDRDAIIRHLFQGRATPAESVLGPQHWAGSPGLAGHAYDPAQARRLLARAGYSPGRPLRLSYKTSTDPFRLRIAHVFQQQLAEVGIELTIASYDWGTFFGDIKAGRFQLYSLAWVGVNTPDILRYIYHSEAMPPAGANRGRYRSASVDALIDRAERTADDEAAALYRAIQQQAHQDLVYVPLWYEANVVLSRGVDGYAPTHDGSYLALNQLRMSGGQH